MYARIKVVHVRKSDFKNVTIVDVNVDFVNA